MSNFLIDNNILISSISYIVVIISAIFIAYQAHASFSQLHLMKKDYTLKNEKEEFHTALKMSLFYSREILPCMNAISYIFTKYDLLPILNKIKDAKPVFFDEEEYEKILTEEERKKIETLFFKFTIDKSFLFSALELCSDTSSCDWHLKRKHFVTNIANSNKESTSSACRFFDQRVNIKFLDMITKTANNLEYFSMYFNTNLAESKVVFPSLHQTFLELVYILYFYIARRNTSNKNSQKYFTHIITLFTAWRNEDFKNIQEEEAFANKARECVTPKAIKK